MSAEEKYNEQASTVNFLMCMFQTYLENLKKLKCNGCGISRIPKYWRNDSPFCEKCDPYKCAKWSCSKKNIGWSGKYGDWGNYCSMECYKNANPEDY